MYWTSVKKGIGYGLRKGLDVPDVPIELESKLRAISSERVHFEKKLKQINVQKIVKKCKHIKSSRIVSGSLVLPLLL